MTSKKNGYGFERAVFDFVTRLDTNAEVLFDHKVLDRDTGTPRQCDVWINAKVMGHFPISVLVSCKDHGRKLDVGDIGSFCNEVDSTGASYGIIYARAGFTKPALAKAKANGHSCCRLYLNEPSEPPEAVAITCFLSNPRISIAAKTVVGVPRTAVRMSFDEIFSIPTGLPNGQRGVVLDLVLDFFYGFSQRSVIEAKEADRLPQEWTQQLRLYSPERQLCCVFFIEGSWKHYRGLARATLLNGSYCFADDSYFGWLLSPNVHVYNADPGEEWEKIEEDTPFTPNALIIPIEREIRLLVVEHFGQETTVPPCWTFAVARLSARFIRPFALLVAAVRMALSQCCLRSKIGISLAGKRECRPISFR